MEIGLRELRRTRPQTPPKYLHAVQDNSLPTLLPWRRWEPRRTQTLRRRPDAELASLLQRDLSFIAPAIGQVCGADSTTMRLVARAAFCTPVNPTAHLRYLHAAKEALDRLSVSTQHQIRDLVARMNADCPHVAGHVSTEISVPQPIVAVAANDPSLTGEIGDMLHPIGFQVRKVAPSELLPVIEGHNRPAIAIVELLAEEGGGLALAQRLVRSGIPVVVLCGMPVDSTSSILVFLSRRFDRNALVSAVFRALG